MEWTDRLVLVTGAGGFIGSHLVQALLDRGARVRAFVRYTSRPDAGNLRLVAAPEGRLETVAGDLRDPSAVLGAMRGCEYVFHLGALIAIPYSYIHPVEVVHTNVVGTLNVLEAARITGPRRVVHTSTSEVYGSAQRVPMDERHPLKGQSPYSASKIGADKLAESYYCAFGLDVVTVRPFNTFGPRQSARAVIPTVITQLLAGQVVRLGSLTPTRDFTYVTDTVNGFLAAAAAEHAVGREINLGNDKEISVGDLTRLIASLMGREALIAEGEERVRPSQSEVTRLRADATLARELLGWRPDVSIADGLRRTIEWIESNQDRYRVGHYEV
jgi:NAD dependent epimerase/dehydratase